MLSKFQLPLAISFSIVAALISPPGEAAKSRSGRAAPGGGVYLQTPNPRSPVEHNNRGVELANKGLWPDAIREHEIALQMDPYNSQWRTNLSAAHLEYGKFLAAKGKKDLSMSEFRRAMIIDPANAAADAELDKVMASLRENPGDLEHRKRLAEQADAAGQYDTAIVEWRKVVKMADTPVNRSKLGYVLLHAGGDANTVNGFKELRKAVGMDWSADQAQDRSNCHLKLGEILKEYAIKAKERGQGELGMKRLYNAATEFRRAATLNPGNFTAISELVSCGQMAVAIKPSFDNHMFLAGAYLLESKFPNAQAEYNECFRLKPNDPQLDAARVAFHQRVALSAMASPAQVAESVTKIRKLIDEDPNNARYYYILGRLRERQVVLGTEQSYDKAKKCYEKAMSINPEIDPDLKLAFSRIGAAPPPVSSFSPPGVTPEQAKIAMEKAAAEKNYTELENQVESGNDLDAVIARGHEMFGKNNKDGRIAGLLGRAYEKKGDPDSLNSAKSWYRIGAGLGDSLSSRFLEQVDANRVLSKLSEADSLLAQGKFIDAKSIYQDVLIMAPRRADVHRKLGDCLKAIGDQEGSKKEYADADSLEKGGSVKSESAGNKSSDGIGGAASGKEDNGARIAKTEKPQPDSALKADSLQMQPMKKKK